MSNFVTSLVRTYVPIIVGAVISWLAVEYGIVVDTSIQAQAVAFLTGILIAAYYTLVRMLAKKWPALEKLLGSSSQPVYSEPPAA